MNEQKEKEIIEESKNNIKENDKLPKEKVVNSEKKENNKKDTKKKSYKKIIVIIISIIAILSIILSVIFAIINMNNSKILSNITINGVKVSNMSKEEAILELTNLSEAKKQQTIDLSYQSENSEQDDNSEEDTDETKTNITTTALNFKDLELTYDITQAVHKAYKIGRQGNLFQNNFEIIKLLLKGSKIELTYSINDEVLSSCVDNISAAISNKVVQASYYIEENNLIITRGSAGNCIDEDILKEELNALIYNISETNQDIIEVPIKYKEPDDIDLSKIHSEIFKTAQNAYYEKEPFKVYSEVQGIDFDIDAAKKLLEEYKNEYTIPLIITAPEITVKDLDINVFSELLGSFTTKYDASNTGRSTNLKLAANKINGTILSPGETFSYNKIVGERTIAAGYKEAKIYSAGQVVDGLGGGICQISSTLYNAVIFANLDVTERHNHQFVTSYVAAGRDATVVYGAKDFKFKNTRNYPIKINMSVSGGIASASIYGIKEEVEYEISFNIERVSTLIPTVKYEQSAALPSGTEQVKQKGTNGVIVKDYKVVKLNGNIVSSTLIAQDTYNAMDKIIIQGIGTVTNSVIEETQTDSNSADNNNDNNNSTSEENVNSESIPQTNEEENSNLSGNNTIT